MRRECRSDPIGKIGERSAHCRSQRIRARITCFYLDFFRAALAWRVRRVDKPGSMQRDRAVLIA